MSIREIANIGATSLFGYVKIGLMIVFVAVVFATIFATLKRVDIDIVALAKQIISKNRARPLTKKEKDEIDDKYAKGFLKGLKHYTAKPSSQPCENGMCSRTIAAPVQGALVRNPNTGRRKIVCAECAPAYIKTGWIPEMTWGEEFKSAAMGLLFGTATRLLEIPSFLGSRSPPFNIYLFALRLGVYALGGIIAYWIVWGSREDQYEPYSLAYLRKTAEEDEE